MSEAIRKHAIRYPHARTSTLVYIEARERKTEQLRAENEARRRASLSWPRRVLSSLIRGWGAV